MDDYSLFESLRTYLVNTFYTLVHPDFPRVSWEPRFWNDEIPLEILHQQLSLKFAVLSLIIGIIISISLFLMTNMIYRCCRSFQSAKKNGKTKKKPTSPLSPKSIFFRKKQAKQFKTNRNAVPERDFRLKNNESGKHSSSVAISDSHANYNQNSSNQSQPTFSNYLKSSNQYESFYRPFFPNNAISNNQYNSSAQQHYNSISPAQHAPQFSDIYKLSPTGDSMITEFGYGYNQSRIADDGFSRIDGLPGSGSLKRSGVDSSIHSGYNSSSSSHTGSSLRAPKQVIEILGSQMLSNNSSSGYFPGANQSSPKLPSSSTSTTRNSIKEGSLNEEDSIMAEELSSDNDESLDWQVSNSTMDFVKNRDDDQGSLSDSSSLDPSSPMSIDINQSMEPNIERTESIKTSKSDEPKFVVLISAPNEAKDSMTFQN